MKLCDNLLRLTGDPGFADEMERSAYNALLSAAVPDGSSFAKVPQVVVIREHHPSATGRNLPKRFSENELITLRRHTRRKKKRVSESITSLRYRFSASPCCFRAGIGSLTAGSRHPS
jgi:hypothetical protein